MTRVSRPDLLRWLLWSAVLTATTGALFVGRGRVDKAHVALVLLLVVLLGASAAGRAVGLWLAGASFLLFNWFFLPPYSTFVVANPLDWLVLVAFLVTGVVAAQLLARARAEASAAEERAAEVDRLAALGAETLSVGLAEEALLAIANVIRESTGVTSCEVLGWTPAGFELLGVATDTSALAAVPRGEGSLVASVGRSGTAALEHVDGTSRRLPGARPDDTTIARMEAGETRCVLLPLQVRERTVGVLRLCAEEGLRLDRKRWRFIDAISYYAALGVERVRLAAEAARADALREADRLKDALLASVSHDLRTPLTTIKALAHDLRGLGDERTVIIEHEANRLNRMVGDLLDLSRINAGALTPHIEVNAVDDLLGAVLQQVEPALGGRRVQVSIAADEPLLLGRFDLVHSLRILVNLVENAGKYAPRDTPIEIRATRRGDAVDLEVLDRGPGVPEAEVERIFEPFFRHPGSAPDAGGAGLGLAIARRLAEAQGGSLTYAPRPGGGSIFTLRLAAATLAPAAPQPAVEPS